MRTVALTFYTRPGCHLCDDALEAMSRWAERRGLALALTEVNIDADEAAHARYWLDIPVATTGETELFRHRFDPAALERIVAAEGVAPMSDLASRSCVPCRGGVPPLGADAIAALLAELGGSWSVEAGHHLASEYRFSDFAAGLAFVNRIGEVAEREGHHPDLELSWGRVGVKIWTHAIDGLTESDFVLAAKIDALAGEAGKG